MGRTTAVLPDQPSALIRAAVRDLKSVRRSSNYVVDMDYWHMPAWEAESYDHDEHACHVCLAGAVMARSLGVDVGDIAAPEDFGARAERKLLALNSFRLGNTAAAFVRLGLPDKEGAKFDRNMPDFSPDDPRLFYHAMEKLASDLEAAGY